MKVLIIGGAGFIGSALIEELLKDEANKIKLLDVFLYGEDSIQDFKNKIKIIRSDFRDFQLVEEEMKGMDVVVHLAAIVGDQACDIDKNLTKEINYISAVKVAKIAKKLDIPRFIFSSTCSVYGSNDEELYEDSNLNPLSFYAESKILAENELLEIDNFCSTILRFGTVFGLSGRARFDLVVNLLTAKALFDNEITVFGGSQWRPFVHVSDAARAILYIAKLPIDLIQKQKFNICYGNYTINEIANMVHKIISKAKIKNNGEGKDRRNYKVSIKKVENLGFCALTSIENGIKQVKNAIQEGRIKDYTCSKYNNFKFLNEGNIRILQDFKKG